MYCTYSRNPTQLELLNDDLDYVPYQLSGSECVKAWNYQVFDYKGTKINIKSPGITKILIGPDIDEEGFCMTRKTTSKVIKGHMELVWSDVTEWVNIEGNPKSRSLDGSSLTWIEGETASKTLDGIIVLSNFPRTAKCNWELLYRGTGQLLSTKDAQSYIIIPTLPAGFKIANQVSLCGLLTQTTDDPSIFVINSTVVNLPIAGPNFQGRWSSLISSGILGLNLMTKLMSFRSNSILLENQCILEYMIRENILQHATTHPNQAALSLLGVPGWTMIVAGNAVVLRRCSEVTLQINPQNKCYTDIPVKLNSSNHLSFIHPITRVLMKSSYEINCQDDALPIFSVRKINYKLSPELLALGQIPEFPSRLSRLNMSFPISGSGLYSHEILSSMDQEKDHTTRKEEITRQLIKMGDGSFHSLQDGSGVLGNMVDILHVVDPGHWIFVTAIFLSILGLILNLLLWTIIFKSRLWLVMFGDKKIAAYQAQLLSHPRNSV